MARDKNLRPCLPLKPQEKKLGYINTNKKIVKINTTDYSKENWMIVVGVFNNKGK
ncbi:MAG: hypothetical protein IPP72_05530 [Chitinophagaceae bacterium]|nr:hypothetical protein [Chitinophagaceae bacterium]